MKKLAAFLVLSLALTGCTATLRTQVRTVSNAAADVGSLGVRLLAAEYCRASMGAIGRIGAWTPGSVAGEGRCAESGPRAGSPATDAERSALETLREQWRAPLLAASLVRTAHTVLVEAQRAESDITAARWLALVGDLTRAYATLVEGARAVGVTLPTLGGTP